MRATYAQLGALIAARNTRIGVHVVEVAENQFDAFLRVDGPWGTSGDAHRAARWLAETISDLLPPGTGERNPRPSIIRLHVTPEEGQMTAALIDYAHLAVGFLTGMLAARIMHLDRSTR